jgi:DNA-3-methyladenine glycosylase
LGAVLECRTREGVTSGRIVETEAYLGPDDPACHAAAGMTKRNRHLHGPPGTAYVYFIYGVHWCVNAVTRAPGHGSAVLIRAVEPVQGLPLMRRRRGDVRDRDLANGPGKLCKALGIEGRHGGTSLIRGSVRILAGEPLSAPEILVTPRIGISKAAHWPLRFVDATSAGASRARRSLVEPRTR